MDINLQEKQDILNKISALIKRSTRYFITNSIEYNKYNIVFDDAKLTISLPCDFISDKIFNYRIDMDKMLALAMSVNKKSQPLYYIPTGENYNVAAKDAGNTRLNFENKSSLQEVLIKPIEKYVGNIGFKKIITKNGICYIKIDNLNYNPTYCDNNIDKIMYIGFNNDTYVIKYMYSKDISDYPPSDVCKVCVVEKNENEVNAALYADLVNRVYDNFEQLRSSIRNQIRENLDNSALYRKYCKFHSMETYKNCIECDETLCKERFNTVPLYIDDSKLGQAFKNNIMSELTKSIMDADNIIISCKQFFSDIIIDDNIYVSAPGNILDLNIDVDNLPSYKVPNKSDDTITEEELSKDIIDITTLATLAKHHATKEHDPMFDIDIDRYDTYAGEATFKNNNWNSGQDIVRDYIYEYHIDSYTSEDFITKEPTVNLYIKYTREEDQHSVLIVNDENFYTLTWYKNRGKTELITRNGCVIAADEYVELVNILARSKYINKNIKNIVNILMENVDKKDIPKCYDSNSSTPYKATKDCGDCNETDCPIKRKVNTNE